MEWLKRYLPSKRDTEFKPQFIRKKKKKNGGAGKGLPFNKAMK
jgi:hypothetical protein